MGISGDEPMLDALAGRLSRRRALEALAGGGMAAGLAAALARTGIAWDDATPAVQPSTSSPNGATPFNYQLGASEPQVFTGGTLRTATVRNIESLAGLSINILEIDAGALRELHWHPNAGEINYVLEGEGTIGILSASQETATFAIRPGSITYVPIGDAHYIRNTGPDTLRLLIGFSNEAAEHLDMSL
ncbi:MAG: cupin domain-containing protein, partial [Chloroflexota bacterium]|nr:cupin domain-containing protein [Chloroflexota bacterium]